MNKWILVLLLAGSFMACKNKQPDISAYKAHVVIERFDKDFFALDTLQLDQSLDKLLKKYPAFLPDYLVKVLGINPADSLAKPAIRAFIRTYKPVNVEAGTMADKALPNVATDISQALRYMQYYFPAFKPDSPFAVTTFIGPMDAFEAFSTGDYGDVRTRNGVGIALQLHLGGNAPLYDMGKQEGLFYDYQTRRFTPEMMVVNSVKNLLDDAFPYTAAGKPLIEEMIEKGKRINALDYLLPTLADTLKIGYTGRQLKGCEANEAVIWDYFVKNDLLYSKDGTINQVYLKDGPKTPELGDQSPGYLGLFVGRQIVRAFAKKHSKVSLQDIMKMDALTLFNQAGYKP